LGKAGRHVAHLGRANPGEGEREEEHHGVLFTEIFGELDVDDIAALARFERKIRSLRANWNCHNMFFLVVTLRAGL
jgi:hypothetical protein